MTIKDFIWILTWSSLVYAAYVTIHAVSQLWRDIMGRPFGMILWLMENWMIPKEERPLDFPEVNYYDLALAMGAAWVIMNTEVDDITEAIGAVKILLMKNEM